MSAVNSTVVKPVSLSPIEQHIVDTVDEPELTSRLQSFSTPRVTGTPGLRTAAESIAKSIEQIPGWQVQIEPSAEGASRKQLFNVVATKQGTGGDGRGLVVAGAHFDTVRAGPGVNDDASGSVALLETAQALANVPTSHDVKLVWFDGEEQGLLGAFEYVKKHPEDNKRTVVMLEAEMIGSPKGSPVLVLGPRAKTEIASPAIAAAEKVGIKLPIDKGRPVGSDHNAFDMAGIPAFVISTTAPPMSRILHDDPNYHSSRDTLANLNKPLMANMADAFALAVNSYANPGS